MEKEILVLYILKFIFKQQQKDNKQIQILTFLCFFHRVESTTPRNFDDYISQENAVTYL